MTNRAYAHRVMLAGLNFSINSVVPVSQLPLAPFWSLSPGQKVIARPAI